MLNSAEDDKRSVQQLICEANGTVTSSAVGDDLSKLGLFPAAPHLIGAALIGSASFTPVVVIDSQWDILIALPHPSIPPFHHQHPPFLPACNC